MGLFGNGLEVLNVAQQTDQFCLRLLGLEDTHRWLTREHTVRRKGYDQWLKRGGMVWNAVVPPALCKRSTAGKGHLHQKRVL